MPSVYRRDRMGGVPSVSKRPPKITGEQPFFASDLLTKYNLSYKVRVSVNNFWTQIPPTNELLFSSYNYV